MQYRTILRQYWGYDDFRGIQRDIIESIASGRDTLGLMPTGGGKSITFQVPALAMKGVCIVFTPLISLMKDQVEALKRRGIKAAYISSGMSEDAVLTVLENSIFGAYKFLYISPERLSSKLFLTKLRRMHVCLVTVDEAHCVCQWGYDFRPSYLRVADIRDMFPDVPLLALTATATPEVAADIQRQLRFRQEHVLRMSFARSNLAYEVRRVADVEGGLLHALQSCEGSAIVYTRSRRRCRELASLLCGLGEKATYYHAGLPVVQKHERQERWRLGQVRVMVATNAFGMGIDKPDVRLVLHADMPDSIEAYFQEAGRAGRDGKPARAVLLTDGRERQRAARRLAERFPSADYVQGVYELLCCFLGIAVGDGQSVTREFNLERFCQTYGYYPTSLVSALELLDHAGYISYRDEEEASSRLLITVSRGELFQALDASSMRLFHSVLRRYGGIFTDYVYIDEQTLGYESGLSVDEVYQIFLRLGQLHLISFIPRRHLPVVTFLRRRVDREDVVLPAAVYGERRECYSQRLGAMLRYADADAECCRSRMLLRYFGEEADADCGVCDVCAGRRAGTSGVEGGDDALRRHVLSQLSGGPLLPSEVDVEGFDAGRLEHVLDQMRAAGEVRFDGPYLCAGA